MGNPDYYLKKVRRDDDGKIKKFKTSFDYGDDEVICQPFMLEIQGDPEEGEWIDTEEIPSKQLSPPLQNISEKLVDKL